MKGKSATESFVTLTLVFLQICCVLSSDYNVFYIEDYCSLGGVAPPVNITVGKTGSNSSGILKATEFAFYARGLNCSIKLTPPPGYGLVVSLRRIEFRNQICEDYLQFSDGHSTYKECGPYFDDNRESRAYMFSESVVVRFHSENKYGRRGSSGFQLTFTAFYKMSLEICNMTEEFKCKNNFCIWKGLTCDSHNNCGDKSDEDHQGLSMCGYSGGNISITGVCFSILIILFVLFGIFCFCCRRRRVIYRGVIMSNPVLPTTAYATSANYGTYGCNGQPPVDPRLYSGQMPPFQPPQYSVPSAVPQSQAAYAPHMPQDLPPPPPPYSQKSAN